MTKLTPVQVKIIKALDALIAEATTPEDRQFIYDFRIKTIEAFERASFPVSNAIENPQGSTPLDNRDKRIATLEDALRWVMPMAKGYAKRYNFGNNEGIVRQAEAILYPPKQK